jgi:CRP/FNR family transcriptional regulator, cyclic AMP receptor protein
VRWRAQVNAHHWPKHTFVGRLPDRSRAVALELGIPVNYQSRQVMVRQGEEARSALLLVSGHGKVLVNADGHDVLLAIRCPGDLIGESASFAGDVRSASVVATGPVVARLISGPEFVDALDRHKDIRTAALGTLVRRLDAADRRAVDFVRCPAPVRVYRVIADLIDSCGLRTARGWQPEFPMSQTELASLAGVGLSTVEKVLVTLQHRGVLDRRYRRIVIFDHAELRRLGGVYRRNPY